MEEEKNIIQEENQSVQEEEKPYKVYETKEAWQENIDTIIGNRLKDYRETKERLEHIAPILEEIQSLCEAESIDELPQKLKEKQSGKFNEADIEKWKKELPDEPWEELSQNEYFRLAMRAGLSPQEACTLASLDKQKQEAAKVPQKPVEESAMQSAAGMMVRITPSKMTYQELDEISARVARGEKISF